jgi:hypothetical protein
MSARGALALALLLLLAGARAPARAQTGTGRPPPGSAALRGQLVRESGAGPLAGLPVVLYAAPKQGEPGIARTQSDAEGRFVFEGISNDPEVVYLVGVRVDELPYGTRVTFAAGESQREVELRIAAPTADASAVVREGVSLRIDRGCGGLSVEETWQLRNPGPSPVYLPDALHGERRPLFETRLPEGASAISVAVGAQGIEEQAGRIRFWGPLHPGSHEVSFTYSVPGAAGAPLRWRFPEGSGRIEVLADAKGPGVSGGALSPGAPREIDGRAYASASAAALSGESALELRVEVPADAPAPLEAAEAMLWLELDDAALVVDANYRLSVPGSEALVATSDAPLLCVPLPEGAEGLRFSPQTLAMGAAPDPSGELALRGPIPAGESAIALRYRLPVTGDSVELTPRFALRLPRLTVFVADTGISAEAQRLHRLRPMRTQDRSYLHLEGFEIAANESVPLRLERLVPQRVPSRLATAGVSLALAAAAIGVLVAPLRGRADEAAADPEAADLAAERASVRAALASLEEDYETGKLDATDYEALRSELRGRTAALIQRRKAAQRPRSEPEASGVRAPADAGTAARARQAPCAAAAQCAACAAELLSDARFCHRCGAPRAPSSEGAA